MNCIIASSNYGAGVRLRCPADVLADGAASSPADRSTRCAFASSATGSAKARGQTLTSFESVGAPTAKKQIPERVSAFLVRVFIKDLV